MKRILACLCAAVLAVTLLAGTQAMADSVEIYLMAENDQMLTLPLEAMPVWIDGSIYVPYLAFDGTYTGVNLGVSYGQTRTSTEYIFTLYSLSGTLIFDVNAGTCVESSTGEDMNMKAVVRNGRVFVPLTGVCRYFGLSYSYTPTSYGTLIRITNGQEWLSTTQFVDSATNAMRTRYNEYIKAMNSASASPRPSSSGSTSTSTPASPAASGSGQTDQRQLTVALTFLCTGDQTEQILDALDGAGVQALLLFRPEELETNDALIRRAVGSGHAIGLSVSGQSVGQALEALERGSAVLESMLRLRTHIVYLENGTSAAASAAEEGGWVCWTGQVDARDDGQSQSVQRAALLSELEELSGTVRVLLDDSETWAAALSQTLTRMIQAGYTFRLTVETDL